MEASNIPVSMPRVNLKDTIEELLKFTLQSCTNGTLEIDLGLPKELCPRLLKPEPNNSPPLPTSILLLVCLKGFHHTLYTSVSHWLCMNP
ncbi:hypothetical protein Pyn_13748 [Prunus yedoensis var. nudiflora]|uniref:Uncharacterized protein n=1 Tax=Prunus yedoensis var. nudiflora TaxID=2094558 RepID=A0A314UWC5_PRUYE|nr:hypothetical protein Pyn_13748 [Prunus yedoensis var. nudiflora]